MNNNPKPTTAVLDETREIERRGASDSVVAAKPRVAKPQRRSFDWERPISNRAAIITGVAWIAALTAIFATAPPPDPNATVSTVGLLIELGLIAAMSASLLGLTSRIVWGSVAAFAGGGIIMSMALICWAGGHTGAWITTQFVAGAGLAATSFLASSR